MAKILKGKIIHWNCGDAKRAERGVMNDMLYKKGIYKGYKMNKWRSGSNEG